MKLLNWLAVHMAALTFAISLPLAASAQGNEGAAPKDPVVKLPVVNPVPAKPDPKKDNAKKQKDWEKRYYQLLAQSANNAIIREFIADQRLEAARVGLDAVVDQILNNSEIAVSIAPDVEKTVDAYIDEEDKSNDLTMVKAMRVTRDGQELRQREDILRIVQEEARALGFSEAAVKGAQVWVPYSKTVNAYTYSGNPERIRVVFYSGLIDAYRQAKRPNSLRAVIRHELGHIRKRDIRNQIRILSVFFAAGLDVIPDRPSDRLPMPVFVAIDGFLNSFFQELTHRDRQVDTRYTTKELTSKKAEFFRLVKKIQESHSKESLVALAKKLATAHEGVSQTETDRAFAKVQTGYLTGKADANAGEDGFDIKAYFKLLEKLKGVWSNSVEFGADRMVFTAPGISSEDAAYADAILLAGPEANLEALLEQHRAAIEAAAASDLAKSVHYALGSSGSHPNLFDRVKNNSQLEKNPKFRPWLDPFIGAAELWLDVSQLITQLEYQIEDADKPAVQLAASGVVQDAMKKLADGLVNLLVEAVVEDLAGKEDAARVEKFNMLSRILSKRIEDARRKVGKEGKEAATDFLFADAWLADVSKGGRIISALVSAIESDSRLAEKVTPALREKLVSTLKEINPASPAQRREDELTKLAAACGTGAGNKGAGPATPPQKPGPGVHLP